MTAHPIYHDLLYKYNQSVVCSRSYRINTPAVHHICTRQHSMLEYATDGNLGLEPLVTLTYTRCRSGSNISEQTTEIGIFARFQNSDLYLIPLNRPSGRSSGKITFGPKGLFIHHFKLNHFQYRSIQIIIILFAASYLIPFVGMILIQKITAFKVDSKPVLILVSKLGYVLK